MLVAIDLRRYERWVLDAVAATVAAGGVVIALTDSRLSPLATAAEVAFVVAAEGAGPFDSHVGTLALANALVTGVADPPPPTRHRPPRPGRVRLAGRQRPHRPLRSYVKFGVALLEVGHRGLDLVRAADEGAHGDPLVVRAARRGGACRTG